MLCFVRSRCAALCCDVHDAVVLRCGLVCRGLGWRTAAQCRMLRLVNCSVMRSVLHCAAVQGVLFTCGAAYGVRCVVCRVLCAVCVVWCGSCVVRVVRLLLRVVC